MLRGALAAYTADTRNRAAGALRRSAKALRGGRLRRHLRSGNLKAIGFHPVACDARARARNSAGSAWIKQTRGCS
ncbi:MAG: hypothetical protein JNJ60_24445 [Rhodocyclaceae bacterium]|nr:hypothetical protein [Rhodocyclaceae bacterium]